MTVADLGLPVVLYNVPGRSGREIPLDVVVRLAAHPNVVAIKEAAGSVERVSAIKRRCPDFTVLSGDDSLVLPMVSVGSEAEVFLYRSQIRAHHQGGGRAASLPAIAHAGHSRAGG